jgi:hypothetical protein
MVIDFPKPQPGQYSTPKLDSGQRVKCAILASFMIARYIKAIVQISISRLKILKKVLKTVLILSIKKVEKDVFIYPEEDFILFAF